MEPNRLALETSPYLLQHAGNPVDWFPWGEEALRRARTEDKPIFLSVGYSSCHWCHVMERESFENEETARILNRDFVPVKVDREERPDIDSIYMGAVQAMTGRGGWPMSVFLTPECAPFFGGTYFPDTPRHGMPAFNDLLERIAGAWKAHPGEIREMGEKFVAALREASDADPGEPGPLDPAVLDSAVERLASSFDLRNGGFGGAPKFPQPFVIEFLLRRHASTGDRLALEMATRTLDAMARGGIQDQIGGGFHRYSVDASWRVPHFEKMLYDNALLARAYLSGFRATRDPAYARTAASTLDYLLREMADPGGGFRAAQDADTEGEEGRFFTWSASEVREALGGEPGEGFSPAEVELFLEAHGITDAGNFEGTNVLTAARAAPELAAGRALPPGEVEALLGRMRTRLFSERERRVRPGTDGKVIASWNGLALFAFARGARLLDRPGYRAAADATADFLLGRMHAGGGRMLHAWKDGKARIGGFLEDHAHVAEGLLELYRTTSERSRLEAARAICDAILARFPDGRGGFFDTSDDHERLISRPRTLQDGAVPCGGSSAASALLRLSALSGEPRYGEAARAAIARMQPAMASVPLGFSRWLCALDEALGPGSPGS